MTLCLRYKGDGYRMQTCLRFMAGLKRWGTIYEGTIGRDVGVCRINVEVMDGLAV